MKKILALIMTTIMIILPANITFAAENVVIKQACFATVVQIIDGQSIKVKPYGTKDTALVRLVGVDVVDSKKAETYLTDKISGKLVSLTFDTRTSSADGRYNVMIVTSDETVINSEIISKGFAQRDSNEYYAGLFSDNIYAEDNTANNFYYGDSYYYNGNYYSDGNYYNGSYYSDGYYYNGSYYNGGITYPNYPNNMGNNYDMDYPSYGGFFYRNGKTYKYMNNQYYEYINGIYIPTNEQF